MTEAALQYAWEHLRFLPVGLKTTLGKDIILIDPGKRNRGEGPDFLYASFRMDDITYNGAVEIHTESALWYTHGHQNDPNYNKVILHVVYRSDLKPVLRNDGTVIPETEIAGHLEPRFLSQYTRLAGSENAVPCKGLTFGLKEEMIRQYLIRCGTERLNRKADDFENDFSDSAFDPQESLWQLTAARFGGNVNKIPFEMLAAALPFKILLRNRHDRTLIEALLFGTAGFLNEDFPQTEDFIYPQTLKNLFQHLVRKYDLHPLQGVRFAFGGLRPANFPTVRLAQLAGLVYETDGWLNFLYEPGEWEKVLSGIQTSEYWNVRYKFGEPSGKTQIKTPGKDFIVGFILNAWLPAGIFFVRNRPDFPEVREKLLNYAQKLKPEKNHLTEEYEFMLPKYKNALETQGLIHLSREFCSVLRCADCKLGKEILK